MKKLLALALTLALLLSVAPALASPPNTGAPVHMNESIKLKYLGDDKIVLDSGDSLKGYEVTYEGPGTTITVTITDSVTKQVYNHGSFSVVDGSQWTVNTHQYGSFTETGRPRAMHIKFETSSGYKKTATVYQMSEKDGGVVYLRQIAPVYYSHNTASSFGPHMRDLTPNLTKLWYMVTPLDLTRQGKQTYELVGSNVNVIGEVYVDVAGDAVTVTYHNYYDGHGGDTKTTNEFLMLYHHYGEIDPNGFEKHDSPFRFNVPISIARDLGGDTTMLMLVINRVDYCNFPTSQNMLRRFWENTPENKQLRETLTAMIDWDGANDPVQTVEPESTVVPEAEG